MSTVEKTLKQYFQASMLGALIGDAIGQPVETMTPAQIIEATDGRGITTFCDPIQQRFETKSLKAGDFTDDWQLTKAVADSLIESCGFNLENMAKFHMIALKSSEIGWGRSTSEAIAEICLYEESNGKEGRSFSVPVQLKPKRGAGNGVAMKIAPIGLLNSQISLDLSPEEVLENQVFSLGRMTHADNQALISGYAVAYVISKIVGKKMRTKEEIDDLYQDLIYEIGFIGNKYPPNSTIPTLLEKLDLLGPIIGQPDQIRDRVGVGFLAPESVAYSIGIFLSYPHEFEKGILTAVNAGGDSDTNASMVGAMIGANSGLDSVPKEWIDFVPASPNALEIGEKLYQVASSAK